MRFDDVEYLNAFYNRGEYPKIHDDIYSLAKDIDSDNVLDLGCCYGLLSHRLLSKFSFVVGIDSNKKYLEKAIKDNRIKYSLLTINRNNIDELKKIIKDTRVTVVFARRIIPEIYDTGGYELVKELINAFFDCGVKYIAIEGRKSNRNAVNPFKSIKEEEQYVKSKYIKISEYKNCSLYKRKPVG